MSPKIECIIVDDEPRFRVYLKQILQQHFPAIKILAEASDLRSAEKLIKEHKPNLVFLDVEIGTSKGFELVKMIDFESQLPLIVYVTGHMSYAIEAIKSSVFDYLLKPLDVNELSKTIVKVENRLNEVKFQKQVLSLIDDKHLMHSKLDVPLMEGTSFVNLGNIIMFRAVRNYTEITLKDDQVLLASKTLKYFEEKVPARYFIRSHRSYLINIFEIQAYKSIDGGALIMTGGVKANISSSKKDELFERLRSLGMS